MQALKIPAGETCRTLGKLDSPKWEELKLPTSSSNPNGKGVAITYSNGDICDPATRSTRSVTMSVECDHSVDGLGEFSEVKKEATCNTIFTFSSRYGCPADGLSVGSKLLITFFVLLFVYVAGGYAYEYKVREKRGLDALPNLEFWRELPGLVRDGAIYGFERLKDCYAAAAGRGEGGRLPTPSYTKGGGL